MAWTRAQLEALVLDAAQRNGIDPAIAYWQIQAESNWNPNAVSHAGAMGLAQFMPATWGEWGRGGSAFDPVAATDAYGRYMRWLLNRLGQDYAQALAAYNWGIGRVQTAVQQQGANWLSRAPSETRNYVQRILSRAAAAPIIPADPFDFFGSASTDAAMLAAVAVGLIAVIWMVAR